MKNFKIIPWQEEAKTLKSEKWKIFIYDMIRPVLSFLAKRRLSEETLEKLKPDFVLSKRGLPLETVWSWAARGKDLKESTVLIQGTGTGWDVLLWAEMGPRKIIATDLFAFEQSWREIAKYCEEHYGVTVIFKQAPLEKHDFLEDESIDICASYTVFEHCKNLPDVMKETYRVLKKDGVVCAIYGPLWFCSGGDHYSPRGGLRNSFNHLMLNKDEYKNYIDKYRKECESFQEGARYNELDLFSQLTTCEYISIFRNTGFKIERFGISISPQSIKFMRTFPKQAQTMEKAYANRCSRDDFLITSNMVILKK